ncbi:hypothetical protein FQN50_009984 [Emmonsiellopsis sp. PD_5]|nr:hypothetical protein FQN50_009984 [Emmonsiellopsis sp. PD_5]
MLAFLVILVSALSKQSLGCLHQSTGFQTMTPLESVTSLATVHAMQPLPTTLQSSQPLPTTLQSSQPLPTTLQSSQPSPTTLQFSQPTLTPSMMPRSNEYQNHIVHVRLNDLGPLVNPPCIDAEVGDVVQFFIGESFTLHYSTLALPCEYLAGITVGESGLHVYLVAYSGLQWFFAKNIGADQPVSCEEAVFALNSGSQMEEFLYNVKE